MKTKHIGIKQLRQELFKVADELEGSSNQYMILRNNKPVLLLTPVVMDGNDYYTAEDIAGIKQAEEDIRRGGKTYTLDQIRDSIERRARNQSSSARKRRRS